MSTLIRSARFGNQPVLLERNRAPQALAAMSALANGSDAIIDGAEISVQTVSRHAQVQSDAAHALHENRLATGEFETISEATPQSALPQRPLPRQCSPMKSMSIGLARNWNR